VKEPHLCEKWLFAGRSYAAPLVEQVKNAQVIGVQHVEQLLVVLYSLSYTSLYARSPKVPGFQYSFLRLQHMRDVQLVQTLVCEVNTELLEAIDAKRFETVDIK